MPYRFERTDTATTIAELIDLLPQMSTRQHDITQYIAAQCYDRAVGPPMSRGMAAPWYEDFNPDQRYLPFERFQPVEVLEIRDHFLPELGAGWLISVSCIGPSRHTELSFYECQTFATERILSLSVFTRIHTNVDRGVPISLQVTESPSEVMRSIQPSMWCTRPPCDEPARLSDNLLELALTPGIQEPLEDTVSASCHISERVLLTPSGMFHSVSNRRPVARLVRAVTYRGTGSIQFTIELRNGARADINIAHRGDIRAPYRDMSERNVEQERTW